MKKINIKAWDETRNIMCNVVALDWDNDGNIISAHLKQEDGQVYKVYPNDDYGDKIVFELKEQETRLIETDMGYDLAWICEECNETWQFTAGTPQNNNYKYCVSCGRKIVEYVQYNEDNAEYCDNCNEPITPGDTHYHGLCDTCVIDEEDGEE